MIKHFIIVTTIAASCAMSATGQAATRASAHPTTNATVRQLDQAKRVWFGQAVSHILGDVAGRSGAR